MIPKSDMIKRRSFWWYVKVIILLLMMLVCLVDIFRDVAVRSFGQPNTAEVTTFRQLKADEFQLHLTMFTGTVARQFSREISRKNLNKRGNITDLRVRYLEIFPNHIVCVDVDERAWFRSTLALIGFSTLLFGVVKQRI